jgi:hypothetical protein
MTKKTTKKADSKPAKDAAFEPNKMGLAVATAAATTLVLFAAIAIYS